MSINCRSLFPEHYLFKKKREREEKERGGEKRGGEGKGGKEKRKGESLLNFPGIYAINIMKFVTHIESL